MRNRLVVAIGILIGLLAFPHAFVGWPALSRELNAAGVSEDLHGALAVGWCFGSLAMLTLGLSVVWCGRVGGVLAQRCALTIGLAYTAFGLGAMVYRGVGPHFVGFCILGSALAATALVPHRAR